MKLFPGLLFCSLVLGVSGQWYSFVSEAAQGKAAGLGGIQGPLGLALSTFKGGTFPAPSPGCQEEAANLVSPGLHNRELSWDAEHPGCPGSHPLEAPGATTWGHISRHQAWPFLSPQGPAGRLGINTGHLCPAGRDQQLASLGTQVRGSASSDWLRKQALFSFPAGLGIPLKVITLLCVCPVQGLC